MQRGDIALADLEPVRRAETSKVRPVVLVGNDASLGAAIRPGRGIVTIVPLTSNTHIRGRMHVALRPTKLIGLRGPSKAQVEQIRSIDVGRLRTTLGRLGSSDLEAIDEAIRYHLAV